MGVRLSARNWKERAHVYSLADNHGGGAVCDPGERRNAREGAVEGAGGPGGLDDRCAGGSAVDHAGGFAGAGGDQVGGQWAEEGGAAERRMAQSAGGLCGGIGGGGIDQSAED